MEYTDEMRRRDVDIAQLIGWTDIRNQDGLWYGMPPNPTDVTGRASVPRYQKSPEARDSLDERWFLSSLSESMTPLYPAWWDEPKRYLLATPAQIFNAAYQACWEVHLIKDRRVEK